LRLDGPRYVSGSHVAQPLGQRCQLLICERDYNAALLRLFLTPSLAIATFKQKSRSSPVGIIVKLADEVQLTFRPRAREAGAKLRIAVHRLLCLFGRDAIEDFFD
jgi:hypothetical protein